MVCYTSCSVAGVVLFSMVYMILAVDKSYIKDDFMKVLTPELQVKYNQIMKERRDAYIKGFIGGFIISLVSWLYIRNSMNSMVSVCYLVSMTYIIMYVYYTMTPKSDLFVVHLNDPVARAKWAEVYSYMKYNYHMSILLGIVFVGLFSYGICQ